MQVFKLFKRIFCKHKKTAHIRTFLDDCPDGGYITRHVWKCQECGKEIIGGKKRWIKEKQH